MKSLTKKRGYLRGVEAKPKLLQIKPIKDEQEVDAELELIMKEAAESFEDFSCVIGVVAARQAYLSIQEVLNKGTSVAYLEEARTLTNKRIEQFTAWLAKVKQTVTEPPVEKEDE
jgi:hypothetical protein